MKKHILSLLVAVGLIGSASAVVLSSQDLYIANGYNGVSIIQGGSTDYINIYPSVLNGDSASIALDQNGNLFVGNGGNDTIAYIKKGTTIQQNITPNGTWFPLGMASDGSGNIYVANYNSGVITKISPDSFNSINILSGQYACAGIAINSQGDLFIANFNYSTIQVLQNGSTSLSSLNSAGIKNPIQMAFDSHDNLFIANAGSPSIYQIQKGQSSASPFLTFGSTGIAGIAIDKNNNIFFSQDNNIYEIVNEIDSPVIYASSSIAPYRLAFSPIPEPSTYLLFGIGAIGMLLVMRRQKTA